MDRKSRGYALVTGASQGLGKSFALELANRSFNLILVALPNTGLDRVKQELTNFNIDIVCYETDLSILENVDHLARNVNENFELEILINNAGIGGSSSFSDVDPLKIIKIIQVNVMALSLLTRLLLPNLIERRSYILNVSSLAAFSPMGYKTVYPASKAFVHHFTRGLYQELRHTNVFVSVVNPGPMATNPEISERIRLQGWRARLGLLSPDDVARISLKKLFKRDTLIILGMGNGLNWVFLRFIPIWIRLPILTNAIKKELKV